MSRRKSYYIVLDTEACPIDKSIEGVDPNNMLVYDCGWAIVDRLGNVYKTESFVNADIFLGEKELMKSAYYSNKIPKYWEDIRANRRKLTSYYNIRKALKEDIKNYNIKEIYAHNMRFDYGALNRTQEWVTNEKYKYFLPYGLIICDTLKMAQQVVAHTPTYKKFCTNNGYLTKNNSPRLTAEILYRYITKDNNFVESHTGLEDVMIEKEIMRYCFAKHKKMERKLWA